MGLGQGLLASGALLGSCYRPSGFGVPLLRQDLQHWVQGFCGLGRHVCESLEL